MEELSLSERYIAIGSMCAICHCMFHHSHGYPAVCEYCWTPECNYPLSIYKTF